MRISCNGCRILRKGCTDDCTIRPCLQWIHSPDSQAHATLFLAKFYGRAGLINLINAGPQQLRPAIFRSLLYEACGRIVNPIYGSVGLLWSGSWHLCQAAVESVLKGAPITPIATETAAQGHQGPPLKAYDIRHVVKDENSLASTDLSRIKTRKSKPRKMAKELSVSLEAAEEKVNRTMSHDSTLSHRSSFAAVDGDSKESGSTVSLETAETAAGLGAEWEEGALNPDLGVGLELGLTLGFEPVALSRGSHVAVPVKKRRRADVCAGTWEENTCSVDLGLEFRAQS